MRSETGGGRKTGAGGRALGSEMEREKERGGRREGTGICIFEA